MNTVAVAVSGGVDSLAALLLARRKFLHIMAVHGIFLDNAKPPAGLAAICESLKVDLHVADLREFFRQEVIEYFISSHKKNLTPNPCAICNRRIKFGALLEYCQGLGADMLATGHYANLIKRNSQCDLYAAGDIKDQSYFLSLVHRENLSCAFFPLATYSKAQAREVVAAAGYAPPIPTESQDICFLKEGKSDFLLRHVPCEPGPIRLASTGEELSAHSGLCQYTVGQRRGLQAPWSKPLYVRAIDWGNNTIWVAPRAGILMRECIIHNLNLLVENAESYNDVLVKLRYNQKPAPAHVTWLGDTARLRLHEPALATAPGQVAALYDEHGRVLAGGIVRRVMFQDEYGE